MRNDRCAAALLGAVLVTVCVSDVEAQPVGTFRWQLQPYCDVLTLNVTQSGAIYTLDGVDDQCGASQKASVVGTAFANPDGSVGLGLSVVRSPSGVTQAVTPASI